MKRNNINVILCEKIDSSLKNITNITDVIQLDKKGCSSFTVVAFINGIEWDVEKFGLYYFIRSLDDEKITCIGYLEFQNNREMKIRSNGNAEIGTHQNTNQTIAEMEVEELNFPGSGAYELQAYLYEDEEMVVLSDKMEECIKYAKDDNLVSVYSFEVEK